MPWRRSASSLILTLLLLFPAGAALAGECVVLLHGVKTLVRFIEVYCRGNHDGEPTEPAVLRSHDLQEVWAKDLVLCRACRELLAHAFVKRSMCPLDPKPACKHCPEHCYHPLYRQRIREVMKYSGRKLVLSGRIHYLWHLFR